MHRVMSVFVLVVVSTAISACGCGDVGYPAVEVAVQDRVTGRPVALGGAEIAYEGGRQGPHRERRPAADTSSRIWICCTPGEWRVQITTAGYAPFDTTVRVRSEGFCDRPVLVRLVARLHPQPAGQTARRRPPAT